MCCPNANVSSNLGIVIYSGININIDNDIEEHVMKERTKMSAAMRRMKKDRKTIGNVLTEEEYAQVKKMDRYRLVRVSIVPQYVSKDRQEAAWYDGMLGRGYVELEYGGYYHGKAKYYIMQ